MSDLTINLGKNMLPPLPPYRRTESSCASAQRRFNQLTADLSFRPSIVEKIALFILKKLDTDKIENSAAYTDDGSMDIANQKSVGRVGSLIGELTYTVEISVNNSSDSEEIENVFTSNVPRSTEISIYADNDWRG